MVEENFFWAEKIAEQIRRRQRLAYVDKKIPRVNSWSVKSSSSMSGVLHIGRLSDIIRGEAVFRALKSINFPADFIYVTEDMDPLRKVPAGVPKKFNQFIGFPVSDIPDPWQCHASYAGHFKTEFFAVFEEFLAFAPKVFSMRVEYKKGNFAESAVLLLKNKDRIREIIEGVQGKDPGEKWSPWKPICENCGSLQTTQIKGVEKGRVVYVCADYAFETTVAKGCGYEGASSVRKGRGKLVWKSEWAAQWKRWKVCAEGAGKEYESSNSSFWVNARICEEILGFPHAVPVFYEHLIIGGEKMSASKGNVVYPRDWLEVSRPEALKYLYMKKLMRARSFKWDDVPVLEQELDRAIDSSDPQFKDYRKYINVKGRPLAAVPVEYNLIAFLAQLFDSNEKIMSNLVEIGKIPAKIPEEQLVAIEERIGFAKKWLEKHASEGHKIRFLDKLDEENKKQIPGKIKKCLCMLSASLRGKRLDNEIHTAISELSKKNNVSPRELFEGIYFALTGKNQGPKASTLILAFGKEKCLERFKEFC